MDEQLVPGDYTALGDLNIRLQMKTESQVNITGRYSNGEPFKVYEVFPEKNGIVWGRVSSNTGEGQLRFVGLRVNNHPKAKLTKASTTVGEANAEWLSAIRANTEAVLSLVEAIRDLKKNL